MPFQQTGLFLVYCHGNISFLLSVVRMFIMQNGQMKLEHIILALITYYIALGNDRGFHVLFGIFSPVDFFTPVTEQTICEYSSVVPLLVER